MPVGGDAMRGDSDGSGFRSSVVRHGWFLWVTRSAAVLAASLSPRQPFVVVVVTLTGLLLRRGVLENRLEVGRFSFPLVRFLLLVVTHVVIAS